MVSNFQSLSGDAHRETPHRRVLADIAAHAPGTPAPPESDRWGDGLRWLEELDRACTDRRLLAVIDEIERVEDGIRDGWCSSDFLDFLRAAGDALHHIRLLARMGDKVAFVVPLFREWIGYLSCELTC